MCVCVCLFLFFSLSLSIDFVEINMYVFLMFEQNLRNALDHANPILQKDFKSNEKQRLTFSFLVEILKPEDWQSNLPTNGLTQIFPMAIKQHSCAFCGLRFTYLLLLFEFSVCNRLKNRAFCLAWERVCLF